MTAAEIQRRAEEIAEDAHKASPLVNFARIMELVQAAVMDARHEAFEEVRALEIPMPGMKGWTA